MKIQDIAWVAGLLEGEGCFKLQSSGGYKGSIAIAVQMTDYDIVKRIATLLGGTLWGPHGPYGVSKQQTFQTAIFGTKAAAWMMTIYPLMGQRRQEKIRTLLALWQTQPTKQKGMQAICHPERGAFSKNLCMICYNKQYHANNKES